MKNRVLQLILFISPLILIAQSPIDLSKEMLINVSVRGDASKLIDEQSIAGNPSIGKGGNPSTNYEGSYKQMYFPLQIVVDLQSDYDLSELYVYDTHNGDSLHIFTGQPDKWKYAGSILLNSFNKWKNLSLNTNSRYVMLQFPSNKAKIAEILLYGTRTGELINQSSNYRHKLPQIEDFLGANAVHHHPMDKLRCVGAVREYHNWQWDEGNGREDYQGYPNNQYAWNPSWVTGKGWAWNFDLIYKGYEYAELDVSPCLQQSPPYLFPDSENNPDRKPLSQGASPQDPASYKEHSRYLFQFTARYGSKKHPASSLLLKADNEAKSGLGLIRYVENWNEEDKWWKGRDAYFSPWEMAAMCSADYDGHDGLLGPGYGAKVADPNIQFVMGGLTILGLEYIKAMKLWSDFHRKNGFPADVLNFHHYSNESGGQDYNLTRAISPEEDHLKNKLREIVDWRNRHLPGKEIWLSEFGYDSNPASPQGTKAIGPYSNLEVQAQWLVRSYLEIAAAGIDRAHMYFFADLNAKNPNKFNSSGLTSEKWSKFKPKISWYYVYTLKNILSGYRYAEEVYTDDKGSRVYKFENDKNASCVYAAWSGTSEARFVKGFELRLDNAQSAELIELSETSIEGISRPLEINQQKVKVDLSERPIFIRTSE